MEVHLRGVKLQSDELEEGSQFVRRFAVSIRDVEVYNLHNYWIHSLFPSLKRSRIKSWLQTSTSSCATMLTILVNQSPRWSFLKWRLVLKKQKHHLSLLTSLNFLQCVRPDMLLKTEEWRMKVKVLPLRFYIDQDALEFFIRFFANSEASSFLPESEPLYFRMFRFSFCILRC